MQILSLLVLLAVSIDGTNSARILGLFPYPGKSHFIMFEALMKGLAFRGHEVIVYSHFPQKTPIPNYIDISLVGSVPTVVDAIKLEDSFGSGFSTVFKLKEMAITNCENVLAFPPVQKLINSKENFDLIFTEAFNTDCMLPFVYKFQAPHIALCSHIPMPWLGDRFGNPDNPSYIPNHFLPHSDQMDLPERFKNTVYSELQKWYYYRYMEQPTHAIATKYFGESLPPLHEIAKNTSLLIINTSPVLNLPRPQVPAVIEVGGIHIRPAKKLPKDIEQFIIEAKHGVIYFTYGSTVRSETFPESKRKAILDAFAELPQHVIWKWEAEDLPGKPPNVMIRSWLPQFDILSHPNVRVFMTHGGLMGTMEAIYNGVPMLAMPLFGDQPNNVAACVKRGASVVVPYRNITKESLLTALKTLLNDPGYKERAMKLSRAFKDTPMTPLDTAVFWSEYVIRHNGAPYLRSAAVDLPRYQYLLLDVTALLLLGTVLSLVILVFCTRIVRHSFQKPQTESKTKGKKKKDQ
ncbi:UDP-glycosyltransferase UGT5-like [Schistocerca nitens]|uniref:UDP-glycosyltransferase UGT5-like n=1 Tax=Schistocerca nitens TaxID=7011 RepID=UPI002118A39E|nr:UDP-glycosyltransferase UGT5-like [Schistocerca nitens]